MGEVSEIILFHCINSECCVATINTINSLDHGLDIRGCDLSTASAREKVSSGKLKINVVPTLMLVYSDATADLFEGKNKILQCISQLMLLEGNETSDQEDNHENLEDSDYEYSNDYSGKYSTNPNEEPLPPSLEQQEDNPKVTKGSKLKFVFSADKNGKSIPIKRKKSKKKANSAFLQTKELANKMRQDAERTRGYKE